MSWGADKVTEGVRSGEERTDLPAPQVPKLQGTGTAETGL